MMKRLKDLNSTIADIEAEIKKNPHPFLLTTLNRLKIYRDNKVNIHERKHSKLVIYKVN
jgi:hypothetical protein